VSIYFHTENTGFIYKGKNLTRKWIRNTIQTESCKEGNINIIFTNNTTIQKINQTYLSRDYFTDVIAFNFNEGDLIHGDIYIGVETVKTNAQKFSTDFCQELKRVIIHGVLHLIGYNDKTTAEKNTMRKKEAHYLALFKS